MILHTNRLENGMWKKHREDAEEDVKTWLDAIAVSEARIKECRESIHQMKGVAICPSCGASVDADAAFCSACGQKMPEKPKPEPVKEEDVEVIPPEQPSEEPASGDRVGKCFRKPDRSTCI